MNSKMMKYGLIGGVVLIWGLIIARIMNGLNSHMPEVVVASKIPATEHKIAQDTFSLYADYPDPFLPEKEEPDTIAAVKTSVEVLQSTNNATANTTITTPVDSFNPAIIKYTGIITNPEKKIKMAILKVNEQEIVLREKEKGNDFILQKILKDKIIISHKNKRYEIQRAQ